MFRSTIVRLLGAVLLSMILLGAGFAGGISYDQRVLLSKTQKVIVPSGAAADFQLLVDAWKTVRQNYVDQPAAKDQTLVYGAISGMVDALGDTGHSRFLTPEMVKSEQSFESGQLEGIGAEVEMKGDNVVIVTPLEGSPAQKAGVVPGDIILKVDGVDVSGLPLYNVVGKIQGPAGTTVKITLQNPATNKTRDLTITRAVIKMDNVTWAMIPGTTIADVRLSAFSSGATDNLKAALKSLQSQGATGLVLDLRNNPGGLLGESEGVASQFLKSGAVLQEKNAQGVAKLIPVQPGGVATTIPMVVLINQGTASAAEIVSGALQDAGRAPLIGATTFGTGTVLNTFGLSDQSALLLATEEWLTPKGRVIWHHGITPDQAVDQPLEVIPLAPEVLKTFTPVELQALPDVQFLQALKALSSAH
jgi:carboxyl-terminal processing protease